MIQTEGITKSFGSLQVLKGIDLTIGEGEIVAIVGPSGAGKTTLLQIIGTLDAPDSGKLYINGTETVRLSEEKLAAFRNRNIGFVFQFHQLLPEFTALENVMIPAFIAGRSDKEAKAAATALLKDMGLGERMEHKPSELSGGEQQRVSIARALAKNPKILLCDEPTGALDYNTGKQVLQILQDMSRQKGATVIIVTHNAAIAPIADRVIHMHDARVSRIEENPNPKKIADIEW